MTSSENISPIVVWLVDDNQQFGVVFKEGVSISGDIECTHTFTDGKVALETLLTEPEWPNVLLLDINMPKMNGLEVLAKIRHLAPGLPVIMLTVNDANENIQQAMTMGASGYLLKTASLEDVIRAIRSVVQGGVPMDPIVIRKMLSIFEVNKTNIDRYGLTSKEREIITTMIQGKTASDVADQMFLSRHTIVTHLKHIYLKLDVHTRHELVAKVLKEKIL